MALTARQHRFVQEYLVDLNATQAALRAGYSEKTAEHQASRLLGNVGVKSAIDAALAARAARVEVKSDDVLRELLRLAMVDVTEAFDDAGKLRPLKDMPADLRRAIASIEVESQASGELRELDDGAQVQGDAVTVTKLRFWDKVKGLELLGKHLKLFTDRVEHSGAVSIGLVQPYAEPKRG